MVEELVYERNYSKIDINADDVPLYKPLKFSTLLIIIRCVFQTDNKLEPQVYLDECLYEIQMLEYEKIDISDGIDVNKSDKSKECMLCYYWHFLDKNVSYGPYLCDRCDNMVQKCNKLKNIAIVHIKESVYRICFLYMRKREAKKTID